MNPSSPHLTTSASGAVNDTSPPAQPGVGHTLTGAGGSTHERFHWSSGESDEEGHHPIFRDEEPGGTTAPAPADRTDEEGVQLPVDSSDGGSVRRAEPAVSAPPAALTPSKPRVRFDPAFVPADDEDEEDEYDTQGVEADEDDPSLDEFWAPTAPVADSFKIADASPRSVAARLRQFEEEAIQSLGTAERGVAAGAAARPVQTIAAPALPATGAPGSPPPDPAGAVSSLSASTQSTTPLPASASSSVEAATSTAAQPVQSSATGAPSPVGTPDASPSQPLLSPQPTHPTSPPHNRQLSRDRSPSPRTQFYTSFTGVASQFFRETVSSIPFFANLEREGWKVQTQEEEIKHLRDLSAHLAQHIAAHEQQCRAQRMEQEIKRATERTERTSAENRNQQLQTQLTRANELLRASETSLEELPSLRAQVAELQASLSAALESTSLQRHEMQLTAEQSAAEWNTERAQMAEQIAVLTASDAQLREQLQQLEAEKNQSESADTTKAEQLRSSRARIAELESQLAEALSEAAITRGSLESVEAELASSRALLTSNDSARDQELVRLQQALTTANQQILHLRTKHEQDVAALNTEHETAVAALKAEQEAAIAALKAEHERAIKAHLSEHEAAIASLQADAEATVTSLTAEHDAAIAGLRKEIEQLHSERTQQQQQYVSLQRDRDALHAQLSSLTEQLSAAEAAQRKLKAERDQASAALASAERARSALGTMHSAAEQSTELLRQQFAAAQLARDQAVAAEQQARQQLAEMEQQARAQLAEWKNARADLAAQLAVSQARVLALGEEHRAEVAKAEERARGAESHAAEMRSTAVAQRAQIMSLEAQLTQAQSNVVAQSAEIARLGEELAAAKLAIQVAHEQLDRTRSPRSPTASDAERQLQAEVDALRLARDSAQAELAATKAASAQAERHLLQAQEAALAAEESEKIEMHAAHQAELSSMAEQHRTQLQAMQTKMNQAVAKATAETQDTERRLGDRLHALQQQSQSELEAALQEVHRLRALNSSLAAETTKALADTAAAPPSIDVAEHERLLQLQRVEHARVLAEQSEAAAAQVVHMRRELQKAQLLTAEQAHELEQAHARLHELERQRVEASVSPPLASPTSVESVAGSPPPASEELITLQQRLAELESAHSAALTQSVRDTTELASLRSSVSSLHSQLSESQAARMAAVSAAQLVQREWEQRVSQLSADLAAARAAEQSAREAAARATNASQATAAPDASLVEALRERDAARAECAKLKKKFLELDSQDTEAQVDSLVREQQLEVSLAIAQDELTATRKQLDHLRLDAQKLEAKGTETTAAMAQMTHAKALQELEVKQFQLSLTAAQEEAARLRADRDRLSQELVAAAQERQTMFAQMQAAQQQSVQQLLLSTQINSLRASPVAVVAHQASAWETPARSRMRPSLDSSLVAAAEGGLPAASPSGVPASVLAAATPAASAAVPTSSGGAADDGTHIMSRHIEAELSARVESLERALEAAQDESREAARALDETKDELSRTVRSLSDTQDQLSRQSRTLTDTKEELARTSRTLEKAREELTRQARALAVAQTECTETNRTLTNTKDELARQARSLSAAQSESSEVNRTLASTKDELARQTRALAAVQAEANETARTLASVKGELERSQRALSIVQDERAIQSRAHDRLQTEHRALQGECDDLARQVESHRAQRTQEQSAHAAELERLRQVHAQTVDSLRAELSQVQSEQASTAASLSSSQSELARARANETTLGEQLATARSVARGLDTQLTDMTARLATVSEQAARSQALASERQRTVESLTAQAEALQRDLSGRVDRGLLEIAEAKLASAQRQLAELQAAHEQEQSWRREHTALMDAAATKLQRSERLLLEASDARDKVEGLLRAQVDKTRATEEALRSERSKHDAFLSGPHATLESDAARLATQEQALRLEVVSLRNEVNQLAADNAKLTVVAQQRDRLVAQAASAGAHELEIQALKQQYSLLQSQYEWQKVLLENVQQAAMQEAEAADARLAATQEELDIVQGEMRAAAKAHARQVTALQKELEGARSLAEQEAEQMVASATASVSRELAQTKASLTAARARIQALDVEKESLTSSAAAHAKLLEDFLVLQGMVTPLKRELAAAKVQLGQLENSKQAGAQAAQAEAQAHHQASQAVEQQLTLARADVLAAQQAAHAASLREQQLKHQLELAQHAHSQMQTKLQEAERSSAEQRVIAQQAQQQLEPVQAQLSATQEEVASLRAQLSDAEAAMKDSSTKLAQLTLAVDHQARELTLRSKETANAEQARLLAATEMESIRVAMAGAEFERNSLNSRIVALQQSLDECVSSEALVQNRLAEAEERLKDAEADKQDLSARLRTHMASAELNHSAQDDMRAEHLALRRAHQQLQERYDSLAAHANRLQEALEVESRAAKQAQLRAQSQLATSSSQMETLAARIRMQGDPGSASGIVVSPALFLSVVDELRRLQAAHQALQESHDKLLLTQPSPAQRTWLQQIAAAQLRGDIGVVQLLNQLQFPSPFSTPIKSPPKSVARAPRWTRPNDIHVEALPIAGLVGLRDDLRILRAAHATGREDIGQLMASTFAVMHADVRVAVTSLCNRLLRLQTQRHSTR